MMSDLVFALALELKHGLAAQWYEFQTSPKLVRYTKTNHSRGGLRLTKLNPGTRDPS